MTWVLWWLFGQSVLPQPNHSCGSGQSRRCFPAPPVESRISSLDTEPFPESQSGPMALCSQLRGALPLPFVASEKEALPKWEVLGGGRVDLKQLLTLCVFGQIIIANFV